MVATIVPLVQVARISWAAATVLHIGAAALGGAVIGAAAAALGHIVSGGVAQPIAYWLLGLVGCTYGIAEILGRPLPLPTPRRSVPQSWWLKWGALGAAALYGLGLGVGITTVIRFPAFHVLLIWTFLRGDPIVGASIFLAYALGRSVPVLLAAIPVVAGVALERITDLYLGPNRGLHLINGALLVTFSLLVLASG